MMPLLAGLALGLASSAHCAAMCGPLVLTIGQRFAAPSRRAQLRLALLHHTGRALVYSVLAVPAGLAGETLALRGFGRGLAIVAGALLLAAAIGSIRPAFAPKALRRGLAGAVSEGGLGIFDGLTARVSSIVARAFAPVLRWGVARPVAGPLVTGALNGLLPCGLVYAALTAASAAGGVTSAVVLMAGFGIGTSAALVAIAMGAAAISPSLRVRLRPITPLVLAITAVILLVRGAGAPHQHHPSDSAPVHAHHAAN